MLYNVIKLNQIYHRNVSISKTILIIFDFILKNLRATFSAIKVATSYQTSHEKPRQNLLSNLIL